MKQFFVLFSTSPSKVEPATFNEEWNHPSKFQSHDKFGIMYLDVSEFNADMEPMGHMKSLLKSFKLNIILNADIP
jgi:hypothetical protein